MNGLSGVEIMRSSLSIRLGACLLAVLAAGGCERAADTPDRPKYNVLFVTLDTTRADHLGCYEPQRSGDTPNLDALAADGVQFRTCVSASASTPISHASMLTGLYPFQHGVRVIYARSGYRLPRDVPYLPDVLADAGWQTAAFLSSFTVSEFYGFDRAFGTFDSGLTRAAGDVLHAEADGRYMWAVSANQRRSDKTTDAAIAWLDKLDADQPFCMWVHYWDPHDADRDAPETTPPPEFFQPFLLAAERTPMGVARAMYRAEVAYMDSQFGRLINRLKETGRYDNTIIVAVADHGQGLGEHNWWGHRLLYEEQIHLPLIVRVPGWPGSRRVDTLVRSVDVYPTILDALGMTPPGPMAGVSLRGLMHDEPEELRLAYAEALIKFDMNSRLQDERPKDGNLYCGTDGTWKLIWNLDYPAASELYKVREDPDEANNLFAPDHPQVQRLRRFLEGFHAFRTEPFAATAEGVDEEALRALESLGYVGGATPGEPTTTSAPSSRPASEEDEADARP